MTYVRKNPIGLLPKNIFYEKFAKDIETLKLQYPMDVIQRTIAEHRIEDIDKVVSEYIEGRFTIPIEWVQEYNGLISFLNKESGVS